MWLLNTYDKDIYIYNGGRMSYILANFILIISALNSEHFTYYLLLLYYYIWDNSLHSLLEMFKIPFHVSH